tara:strand:- start:120 stop:530 length:411 start_codon:yes stop_codon:yes gene_type:complete
MSKLWDDLKENMKDWSISAVEKAEEMSRMAMAKTEEMTKISKIRFDIHQLRKEKGLTYEKLGKLAYNHTKLDHMATFSGNAEFFEIVNQLEKIKKDIVGKKAAIEKIKIEYGLEDFDISKSEDNVSEKNIDLDIKD